MQNLMFKLQKSLILIHNRCKISLLIYRHTINGLDLILSRHGSFLRAIFQFYYLETDFEIICNLRAIFQFYYLETDFEIICNLEITVSESINEYFFITPIFRAEKLNRCLFIYYQSYIFWKSLKLIFQINFFTFWKRKNSKTFNFENNETDIPLPYLLFKIWLCTTNRTESSKKIDSQSLKSHFFYFVLDR